MGRAQTPDERRGAIDRRLDETLGTFDKEIRKEQEKNAQERDSRNAANAGSGSAQTESSDSKADGDVAGTAGTEGPGKGDRKTRPGDLKSDKERGNSNGNGSGDGGAGNAGGKDQSTPGSAGNPIPDGSDDDVVARRLRKAAEAETDPELKEKLWKEYIEYKKNSK